MLVLDLTGLFEHYRYKDNRHVSMGSEKWLDIELWDSPTKCFAALRKRGYRIATTHLGPKSVCS